MALPVFHITWVCSLGRCADIGGLGSSVVRPLAAGAKGPVFNSPFTQHFQRFISRTFVYNAVGSLVSR